MILFRRARLDDADTILRLALESGTGITTLPKTKKTLLQRLEISTESFNKHVTKPENEYYLFVLEDTETARVVGTSALEAALGADAPFYSYKVSNRTRFCTQLNIRSDYEVLSLVNDHQGKSEICTLYLDPNYRRNGNGLLLSRARFLFIAQNPQRFSETMIADMRGISDEQGNSPFWDHVCSHFFHMSFADADKLTLANKQFIADLMPRNPIYVKLLNPKAQAVIGKPHQTTIPAMNILFDEGFRYQNYVDIFDAGPTLESPIDQIRSIKYSHLLHIKSISDAVSSPSFLIANNQPDFKATLGGVIFNLQNETCIISREVANLLHLTKGDPVRIVPLQLKKEAFYTAG